MRIRHFTFSQKFTHPQTGEKLIDVSVVKNAIKKHKVIKEWAWAIHDKDVYTEHDYQKYMDTHKEEPSWKIGDLKDAHIHVVCDLSTPVDIDSIAEWFKLPFTSLVEYHKGAGAFADDVVYLTHEAPKQQELGKYLYDRSIINTNIKDIDDFIDSRLKREIKKATGSARDELRYEVMFNGLSLVDARKKYPETYCKDMVYLQKCRADYLIHQAPLPPWRLNYYIDGDGGMGKDTCAMAFAKSLALKFNLFDINEYTDEEDYIFTVGDGNVTFDGYDGQPIIIWNDMTAIDLISRFGSRKAVFNALNLEPKSSNFNVKYGKTRLLNSINIFNGVQSYDEFLDGLAGEYTDKTGTKHKQEDKSQSYRRFPMIMRLHESDFDLMMNIGVFNGTREYESYMFWNGIRGNFAKVAKQLDGIAQEKTMKNMLELPIKKSSELIEKKLQKDSSDEIPEEFKDYGRLNEDIESEAFEESKKRYYEFFENNPFNSSETTFVEYKPKVVKFLKTIPKKHLEVLEKEKNFYNEALLSAMNQKRVN